MLKDYHYTKDSLTKIKFVSPQCVSECPVLPIKSGSFCPGGPLKFSSLHLCSKLIFYLYSCLFFPKDDFQTLTEIFKFESPKTLSEEVIFTFISYFKFYLVVI